MAKVLLTGSTGFIGSALRRRLSIDRVALRLAVRTKEEIFEPPVSSVAIGDIDSKTDWTEALKDVDFVIHLASRVHVMKEVLSDPLQEYRRVNVEGTLNLACQAAKASIKRFVFVSSVKVNGEASFPGQPFREDDPPAPSDHYALSKFEAEQGLQAIAKESGMEVVIVRPPLVYGPGTKGNFFRMMRWLEKGLPLPLGAIKNQRSLVALDNLVDLIVTSVDHPAAANQIFLAGDGEDLSTTELLQRMAKTMEKPARLIPVPAKLLESGAILIGKRELAQRLCGSLQVDISKAQDVLGWIPPLSIDEGLQKTAEWYKGIKTSTERKP